MSCSPTYCKAQTMVKAWTDWNYRGSSVELKQSGLSGVSDCDPDGYRWDTLPKGWNDRISSLRAYHGCVHIRAYVDVKTSGHCRKYVADVPYVGPEMNDQISSLRVQSQERNC